MSIDSDRARLSQEKRLESLRREPRLTDMVTVYRTYRNEFSNGGIYCALIPSANIEKAISTVTWDVRMNGGKPGAVEYSDGVTERIEYTRYGDESGIEPLVISREFYGMRADYWEISEEFRLFHNLYHDSAKNEYIKFDDAGNETMVAEVEEDRIRIRLKEVLQFLAIKEMHLSVQFDCVEYSGYTLEELGREQGGDSQNADLLTWRLFCGDTDGLSRHRTMSRLLGKRLYSPLPKSKSGFWGFTEEEEERHVDYIIDVDENGDGVTFSSDPDGLANYFGANPDAPNYLTPVHFRKQVLDKYYQEPGKYSVEDSILRCGSLWLLTLDNHHTDKVCAWLGDLGRDLPYQERLHWKSHNIQPQGHMSETFLRRQILAQPMDSERPEHLFKERYQELKEASQNHLGWQILQPLHPDDEHHFQALRIPATDEQQDFDNLVLSLTKILIDSLHVKRLNSLLSDEKKEGLEEGSIARLEAVLDSHNVEGASDHIAFLRKLYSLRSSSSAHRKGSKYKKIAKQFGIESQNLRDVFAGILWQALNFLKFLVVLVEGGRVANVEENKIEEGYAILSEMIGFVDSGATDGSINHDDLIYELRSEA